MSHGANVSSLEQQVYETLQAKEAFGRSKHMDKALGVTERYIYSYASMRSYIRHAQYFVAWARRDPEARAAIGRRPRTLQDCRQVAQLWLDQRAERGLSPYTLKLEASALRKVFGADLDLRTPSTSRSEITRSRGTAARDRHFSASRNSDLVVTCRCLGPRRFELAKLRASDLRQQADGWVVEIRGKGGRVRLAPLVGSSDEIQQALMYIRSCDGRQRVHSAMDVHAYRAEYATRVYLLHARPIDQVPRSERYYCRGDRRGMVYDRQAMLQASRALGHSRVSVVGEHYLLV